MSHTACGEALLGCMGREMQQVLLDQQLLAVCPVQECLGCLSAFPLQDSSVVQALQPGAAFLPATAEQQLRWHWPLLASVATWSAQE